MNLCKQSSALTMMISFGNTTRKILTCRFIPYEKLREMDKKDIPELLLSVADEADYVDAYSEVTNIESWNVEVTPMSNNYETMGFAFTHQGLKEYEKSIDNHNFPFLPYICLCRGAAQPPRGRLFIPSWNFCTAPVNSFWLTTLSGSMSR